MTDRKAEQSLPSSESKSLAIPFLMHAFFFRIEQFRHTDLLS